MIKVKSHKGNVNVYKMDGEKDSIIIDLAVICVKVLLLIANPGSKSSEEVKIKYGYLTRQLVAKLERSVEIDAGLPESN